MIPVHVAAEIAADSACPQPADGRPPSHAANGPAVHGGVTSVARPSVMRAKLTPPQSTGHEVLRTAICERVFAAGAAKLVLFRAPAGFGKTTAMLQVHARLAGTGIPVAWVTMDRADNDVNRFLHALAAGLGRIIPDLDGGQDMPVGPDELAFALIDRVAAASTPFALFLDDFEVLQNAAALAIMDELVDQMPRGCQLVIGSRGIPELRLGRLRARGRLVEVEPGHLRFSEEEAVAFLRTERGLPLGDDDVRQLHRSTEGWAAGLWLASMSLENREDPGRFIDGFSGSHSAVASYLLEDVFSRQDGDSRRFLLETSVLSELNPSLCDAVTGRPGSARLLHQLESAHMFLIPLQGAGDHYRYHGMFAEFLRMQFSREDPESAAAVHRAASRWYMERARVVPAIEHALAGKDTEFALQQLQEHGHALLEEGRVRLLARWLDPLQQVGALEALPMLQVYHAWAVCLTRGPRGPRGAEVLLDRIERRPDCTGDVKAHCLAMRPLLLSLADRMDEAFPLATKALRDVPRNVTFVSGFLEVALTNLATIAGRFNEAFKYAESARARQMEHQCQFHTAVCGAAEAALDLVQGRLRQAIAGLRVAVRAAGMSVRPTNGNVLAGIPLAHALYEAGEIDQAERLLIVYLPLIAGVAIPDELITGHIVMSRIAAERGDQERAEQLLTELQQIGRREGLQRVVGSAGLERVRRMVVAGRFSHAKAELERCGDETLWSRVARQSLRANEVETHDVATARCAISSGHAATVLSALEHELKQAEASGRERRALTLRLLLAQAHYKDGRVAKGLQVLAEAVLWARGEGYVRPFHVEGGLLLAMLAELHAHPELAQMPDAQATLADQVAMLLARASEPAVVAAETPALAGVSMTAGVSPEPLTRKELSVLKLASEGLGNEEIAGRLFVAETTVRTHLRNINIKLEARNRVEAIAAARRLGLLA